jgi:predicted DCC family thiol-disulfide oxidoreductase YuxK
VGWALYDASCGFCRKSVGLIAGTLSRHGFAIAALQESWVREKIPFDEEELVSDFRLLLADGRHYRGADAYRQIMKRIGWLYPLYWLTLLPGLRQVFDGTYQLIARNRSRISGVCGSSG